MLTRRDLLRRGAGGAAVALTGATALDLAPLAHAAGLDAEAGHRLGFRSLGREVTVDRLPQSGRLPDWLRGTLVRNGPAMFEVGERTFNHWFDGLAMLHAFTFAGGRVRYANRFLRSSAYAAWKEHGEIRYSEFATDPCRSVFKGAAAMFVSAPRPNANVNVARLGRRFVAMTELPMPVAFDPQTLRTLGVSGPQPPLGRLRTAHPHVDPETGERFTYETSLVPPSAGYVVYRGDRPLATIPMDEPSYVHSFAMTRRHLVLAEYPFALNPLDILQGWRPVIENYRWRPGRPARFFVVDRASGAIAARLESDPFFSFHHVNAFERDGRIHVDLCAYPDAEIIDRLYLKRLRSADPGIPRSELRRYVLDPARGTVERRTIMDATFELPRKDDARNGRPYRFAYGTSLRDERRSRFIDQLTKIDVETGRRATWSERGCFPGEPVLVRAPRARTEDDGVVLSVVLDALERTSYLLVLDARTFTERARATVPHHIPFGFHGSLF